MRREIAKSRTGVEPSLEEVVSQIIFAAKGST
jgi:hypothetical protein